LRQKAIKASSKRRKALQSTQTFAKFFLIFSFSLPPSLSFFPTPLTFLPLPLSLSPFSFLPSPLSSLPLFLHFFPYYLTYFWQEEESVQKMTSVGEHQGEQVGFFFSGKNPNKTFWFCKK